MKFISVLAILVLSATASDGAVEKPAARVFLNMESASVAWKTRAVRGTVVQFLSSFEQVSLVPSLEIRKFGCDGRDVRCLLGGLAREKVDVAILGRFDGKNLELTSYETWSRSKVANVSIPLDQNISLTEFKHRIFKLVQPFLEVGGLLDQFYAQSKPPIPYKSEGISSALGAHVVFAFFLFFAFLAPFIGVREMAKRLNVSLPKRVRHRMFSFAAAIIFPLGWMVAAILGPKLLSVAESFIPSARYLVGGVSWALIIILFQRFTVPSLRLLEKTTFNNLFPILRTWFNAVVIKITLLSLIFLPMVIALILLDVFVAWSAVTLWMIVIPSMIIVTLLCYLVWVAELTIFLDSHLVYGFRRNEKQWEKEIKKYIRGYVNRLGIQINDLLIEKTKFIPTKYDGIYTYGGGLMPRRLLISSSMLAYAMGPLKDNENDDEAGFADYTAGVLFAGRRKRAESEFNLNENIFKKAWRRFQPEQQPVEIELRSQAAKNFNPHNATILGYVVPANPDSAVPLIANNREDFEVVGELLTEHYSEFEKDQDNMVLDDSDPTDKDFLFGGLLRELIVIEQNEHFALTFVHAFRIVLPQFHPRLIRIVDAVALFARRYLSRFVNELTDSYTALNLARHHLVQYLFFSMGRKSRLTARADSGQLYSVSRQILEEVQGIPMEPEDTWSDNATIKNRLSWIADLFFKVPGAVAARPKPWLGPAAIGLLFFVFIGLFLGESIQYHEIYKERIERLKEKIENSKQEQR